MAGAVMMVMMLPFFYKALVPSMTASLSLSAYATAANVRFAAPVKYGHSATAGIPIAKLVSQSSVLYARGI